MACRASASGSAGTVSFWHAPWSPKDRVFTMDAEGTISAFDAQTGSLAWRYEPEDLADEVELGGGLAYDGGWLFATLSSGTVIGLNATSGTEVWHQSLLLPLRAAPTVADGRLLVVTRRQSALCPGWRDRSADVAAHRLLRGRRAARRPEPGGRRQRRGGALFVRRGVRAAPRQRPPLWNDTVQRPRRTQGLAEINDIDGMPVIEDSRVYVASYGGQMAAIDLLRGIRVWDIDLASTQTPWLAGDFIYLLTTRGEVVCLLRENGRVRWVSPLPRLTDPDDPDLRADQLDRADPGRRSAAAGRLDRRGLDDVALQRRDPGPHRSARTGADPAGRRGRQRLSS